MRTISVRQKTPLYNEADEAPLQATTAAPAAAVGEAMMVPTAPPADRELGKLTAVLLAWTPVYQLRDEHDNLVSKIVNPGAFWDTTQEVYNCKGDKIGSVTYHFKWKNFLQNRYTEHHIHDANGNHVADLAEDESESNGFFGSRQFFIYLKD